MTSIEKASCRFSMSVRRLKFGDRFPTSPVDVKEFFVWVLSSPNAPCPELIRLMTGKAIKLKELQNDFMFLGYSDAVLDEMRSEKI